MPFEPPRYESSVDRQIREAMERGEFSDLKGAGQPIAGLDGRQDDNWWLKGLLERENLSMPLPESLQLRKEVDALPETLADVAGEDQARELIADLNARIATSHRRRLDGPPIHVRLIDEAKALERWREDRRQRPTRRPMG